MTSRNSRAKAFGLFCLAVALIATVFSMPGKAAAAHDDCTLVVTAPSSYYGIAIITSGAVECGSAKNTMLFSIALTRDGVVVESGDRRCHKRTDCWSYLVADDGPGDQLWCTHASARVGSHPLTMVTRCEQDAAL